MSDTTLPELPPLPERIGSIRPYQRAPWVWCYSGEQMRAYAIEAITADRARAQLPTTTPNSTQREAFEAFAVEWTGRDMKYHEAAGTWGLGMDSFAWACWQRARAAAPADWYEAHKAECTRDHGEYPADADIATRLRWWVPKSARHGTLTLEDDLHEAAEAVMAAAPAGEAQSDKAFHDQMTWGAEFKRLLNEHWEASAAARLRTRDAVIAHVNLLHTGAALGWRDRAALAEAAPPTQLQGDKQP